MGEEAILRAHVEREILAEPGADIGLDDDLFQVLDSLEIIRIAALAERVFGIEIEDHEMIPDNLKTIRQLSDLVRRKRGAATNEKWFKD
jgi:acyl carrier protein